jgi:hypothetical protein
LERRNIEEDRGSQVIKRVKQACVRRLAALSELSAATRRLLIQPGRSRSLLADLAPSRLLKQEWAKTVKELEG